MCIRDRYINFTNIAGYLHTYFVGYNEFEDENQSVFNFYNSCLLYTSDAADERSSVDLGGRRIIKKKNNERRMG